MTSNSNDQQKDIESFADFTVNEVLKIDTTSKSIFFEGKFKNKSGKAVVIFEKTAFTSSQLPDICTRSTLRKDFVNDLYGSYFCFPEAELNCNSKFYCCLI